MLAIQRKINLFHSLEIRLFEIRVKVSGFGLSLPDYGIFFYSVALRPNAGHGLLILDVSGSHTTTHHSR